MNNIPMKTVKKQKAAPYKISEVTSVVSHQLKTPLSAVKGYLEELLSGDLGRLTSEQKEYLSDALENTNRMIVLVKDILDVARIEENRMEFRVEPVDFIPIVQESIKGFLPIAKAQNCSISFSFSPDIPFLRIDGLKMKQVVDNLIFNAIAYNRRKGHVKINVERESKAVVFCCRDMGIGIEESEKKKIFSKFYRSEEAITHTTGGSGLGLFIAKAIIEKSGGKIWFESKKGAGSTFCFSLPLGKNQQD